MHRGTRRSKHVRRDKSAGWNGFACGRRANSWIDRAEWSWENDGAERDSRADAVSRRVTGDGKRSVDGTRQVDARRFVYCGCGGAAAVDSSVATAGLRGRCAPAIRSGESGRISGQDDDSANEQGERTFKRDGGATALGR